ncbi:amidase [Bordetella genomosp. 12]|uniref:Amidase n=1 Tax=Bordetella genomosp. 12 TaxID=463035 RepID=A0A261VKI9_9BORD|nr:amidase [Bordetella genomosp. 12]OZI74605.1 amidase [Bordetella genomosp. 12]
MTPAGLPASIAALRAALAGGELSVADALAAQREAFARQRWDCVANLLPAPPIPARNLPLAGVGLAHKDIFVLPEHAPHCGAGYAWPGADEVSPLVQGLAAAGAPPLATLVMAEHACGATGENPRYPLPQNPLDAQAAVGGSSSGSAVAVAAGLCYASLGTDTAGSVRIPAATCGLLGLKPTAGLLSNRGVAPLAPSLDTVGLLARSADDLRRVWEQLVPAAQSEPVQRIGTCWRHPEGEPDAEVLTVLEDYADRCAPQRREVALPGLSEWSRLGQTVLYAQAYASHAPALRGQEPALGSLARALALTGAALPEAWLAQAQAERDRCTRDFLAQALADNDVLLTPALPRGVPDWEQVLTTSARFEARRLLDMFRWFAFVNYLGLPALVFPVGRDRRGRPVCVQAIGRAGAEARLLALAQASSPFTFSLSQG